MTDLANSCATPLFRRPQDSQGFLEKQNHPLSSNLVIWCAKIEPKTKKVWETSELTKKLSKMMVLWQVFWSFLVLGPILVHQTTKFELSRWFCFSRHAWEPWVRLKSGAAQKLAKSVTVLVFVGSKDSGWCRPVPFCEVAVKIVKLSLNSPIILFG